MSRASFFAALVLLLAACSKTPVVPQQALPTPDPDWLQGTSHYVVDSDNSLLTIQLYRDGPMASMGHNHVIASRNVSGNLYLKKLPDDVWFELTLPVNTLEVDPEDLRKVAGDDFAAPVPEDAIAGTRANMLGAKLLDSVEWPDIQIVSVGVTGDLPDLQVAVAILVKGEISRHELPVSVQYFADRIVAESEFSLSQRSLGLEPFSVMMGALSVRDEMKIQLRLVALPAVDSGA